MSEDDYGEDLPCEPVDMDDDDGHVDVDVDGDGEEEPSCSDDSDGDDASASAEDMADAHDDAAPVVAPVNAAPVSEPPPCSILDHHSDAIRDYQLSIAESVLFQAHDELVERWLTYGKKYASYDQVVQCAYKLFGVQAGAVDVDALAAQEKALQEKVLHLYYRMVNDALINKDVENSLMEMNFTRILEAINNMACMIRYFERIKLVTDQNLSLGVASAVHKWQLQISETDDEATRYQKFLLYLLKTAYGRNLRKYNGRLYRQIVVNSFRTHAWEVDSEISDFVYSCAMKEKNFEMWLHMTSAHSNISNAIDYLKSCVDFELPTLQPNRHVFSFRNCIYDAEENEVYEFGNPACQIPASLVAAKFFNLDFPLHFVPISEDWRNIPTVKLDHILDHQKIPTHMHTIKRKEVTYDANGRRQVQLVEDLDQPQFSAKEWFYVFIGRMIYEIHEHDDWQVLLFIKGVAGSGKSTLGKIVSYLYDTHDVGVLSNNTEKKFGLSALVQKLIYVCYEVKNDFALDQGEFQCMVSGEQMAIPFKFQTAQSVSWKTHGMFMGNEVASWCDNSGSMSRRIVLGLFNEVVTDGNPKLFQELQEEMANILLKCNKAYRIAAAAFGALDVWNVLPSYFVTNRRQLRANTHPLAYFFENTTELLWDKKAYMSLLDLQLMMNIFLSSDGSFKAHRKGFNSDFYQWVMDAYELRVETDVREYKGNVTTLPFVTGITDKTLPHYLQPQLAAAPLDTSLPLLANG